MKIDPSRSCQNCDHATQVAGESLCLQGVAMADGSERPPGFRCPEHQTPAEWQLDLHRVHLAPLAVVAGLVS